MTSSIKGTLTTLILIATINVSGCVSTQQRQVPPSFPALALEDHPVDPEGFCLSKEEAAKLGVYIRELQGMVN